MLSKPEPAIKWMFHSVLIAIETRSKSCWRAVNIFFSQTLFGEGCMGSGSNSSNTPRGIKSQYLTRSICTARCLFACRRFFSTSAGTTFWTSNSNSSSWISGGSKQMDVAMAVYGLLRRLKMLSTVLVLGLGALAFCQNRYTAKSDSSRCQPNTLADMLLWTQWLIIGFVPYLSTCASIAAACCFAHTHLQQLRGTNNTQTIFFIPKNTHKL